MSKVLDLSMEPIRVYCSKCGFVYWGRPWLWKNREEGPKKCPLCNSEGTINIVKVTREIKEKRIRGK